MEKRGGNEQHAARITVGVWTFISLCPLLVLGDLNFDRVSFCVARSWLFIGLYLGPQPLRECFSTSIYSAGCVVITLVFDKMFSQS